MYVFFNYRHNPGDKQSYVSLGFESHPGSAITTEEWEKVLSFAEEAGLSPADLEKR
ncbi:MAG: hypothetical protein IJ666_03860 [Ruminococcus sp.]|nr:hypothetical protein [Ruminococcus sp.]